jgi:low temperature requirement protein LtrA
LDKQYRTLGSRSGTLRPLMTDAAATAPELESGDPVVRVTTLELFFDLVFVFTITQLTSVLVGDLSWESVWHVTVMLGLIFWMYDGYAWLTNAVPARGTRRQVLLLGGMAGYMVVAVAVPDAYGDTAELFALALLGITALHAFLYVRAAGGTSSAAMRQFAPVNLATVLVVVLGAFLGGTAQEVIWTAVFLFEWVPAALGKVPNATDVFEIGPAHFVERHGLLVIVAIGESVVAIGIGASHLEVDAELVALVVLGLAVSAALWWAYFGRDENEEAEEAMQLADPQRRVEMALRGFGYSHLVLLLGVILAAVGIEYAIAHPGETLKLSYAFALSGGVGLFLVADAFFRWELGLGRSTWRVLAAVAALLAIPVGIEASAVAGLAALVALLVAALALEPEERYA